MNGKVSIRLGTRGSPLAMAQTREVADALRAAHPELSAPGAIEIVVIRTTGDRVQNRTLADQGGKGLFIKEIEEALELGLIDAGVHSAKDVPTHLPAGMRLAFTLPRADPRDAFFSLKADTIQDLPAGSIVGTASPRREALLRAARPDLRITLLRGNVDSRLTKLEAGEVDATILAVAGVQRLGVDGRIQSYLDPVLFVPAAGQGTIAIEIRAGDQRTEAILGSVHDPLSGRILEAERAVVAALDGSCNSPIAAWGRVEGDAFVMEALAAKLDGLVIHRKRVVGALDGIIDIGRQAGSELKANLPPGFFPVG